MSLYSDVKVDLTQAEGRSPTVYVLDGILHGGIGHRLTHAELDKYSVGDVISTDQIDVWFDVDYQRCLKSAEKQLPQFSAYPRVCQIAIMNWIYQLGTECFEKFPRATEALQKEDWRTAAAEWLYANPRTRRWSRWRMETQHRCEQEAERLLHAAEEGLGT